jgi:hypothetical protein
MCSHLSSLIWRLWITYDNLMFAINSLLVGVTRILCILLRLFISVKLLYTVFSGVSTTYCVLFASNVSCFFVELELTIRFERTPQGFAILRIYHFATSTYLSLYTTRS